MIESIVTENTDDQHDEQNMQFTDDWNLFSIDKEVISGMLDLDSDLSGYLMMRPSIKRP